MTIQLGIRGHDVKAPTFADTAARIHDMGFSYMQLALAKTLPNFEATPASLTQQLATFITDTLAPHNIQIAVLGCYINVIHPDRDERQRQLDYFKAHLHFVKQLNGRIVGTETGSVIPNLGYSTRNYEEEAYQDVVRSVAQLVEVAEREQTIVGIEGGINHPLHTPAHMARILRDLQSPAAKIIYDPANFLHDGNYTSQQALVEEALQLFGDDIVAVHAKDFIVHPSLHFVPVGSGQMRYHTLFAHMKTSMPHVPVLLENTQHPHIESASAYLREQWANA